MTESPTTARAAPEPMASPGRPLFVALEGGLIGANTLHEALRLLFKQRPWLLLLLPLWWMRGSAGLRQASQARIRLEAHGLPYRRELIDFLRAERAAGRSATLIVAREDAATAELVAEHLGLFDEVLLTDELGAEGPARVAKLKERAGSAGFDYVGGGARDWPLLEAAAARYVAAATPGQARQAERIGARVLSTRRGLLSALIKQLRPHQWAKNALVFLPVLLMPGLPNLYQLWEAALGTAAFCMVASAGYVFNDLIDLEADRSHHSKHKRPLASGDLPVALGGPLFFALIGAAAAMAWALPASFALMLVIYFGATLAYSFYLKSKLVIDVLLLAGFYTHRILAGGIAASIPISAWLLAFSMFFFLSLALGKRYVELLATTDQGGKLKSRGYRGGDLEMVGSMGTGAGYIAVLVFSLYIDSDAVRVAYHEPALLWLICPVLLYWISRFWFLSHRGEMQDDPVKFAVTDRASLACGAIVALVAMAARFTPDWLLL